jgi:hypothetical protein
MNEQCVPVVLDANPVQRIAFLLETADSLAADDASDEGGPTNTSPCGPFDLTAVRIGHGAIPLSPAFNQRFGKPVGLPNSTAARTVRG